MDIERQRIITRINELKTMIFSLWEPHQVSLVRGCKRCLKYVIEHGWELHEELKRLEKENDETKV